jgi:methyl-accepting chemotaxis protein
MPYRIEQYFQQLSNSFQQALYLHQKQLQELVALGKITQEEADGLAQAYAAQLENNAAPVEWTGRDIELDLGWLKEAKNVIQEVAWKHELYSGQASSDQSAQLIAASVKKRGRQIQEEVNLAFADARQLFEKEGRIQLSDEEELRMTAINQITHERLQVKLPKWFLGRRMVQHSTEIVDQISKRTHCKATIFQRIPQGFLRIATNIETLEGKRAVGTFIPNDSPVIQSILKGKTYRGSAFVLNNWYASVYEPFEVDGEIRGILYIGIKEELTPAEQYQLERPRMKAILESLFDWHSSIGGKETAPLGKIIDYFTRSEHQSALSAHPLLEMGLKELAVLLMQEKERRELQDEKREEQQLRLLRNYVRQNLSDDISVDALSRLACMSQASLYRYFRDRLGSTPVEFVNNERLKQAARMLEEDTNTSVQTISLATGFKNCSYFIKLFKERYGLTPKQYREANLVAA